MLALALLAPFARAGNDVGRIPASYQVDPDGGFDYVIPITLPPGPHGVTPQLSLAYNSSSAGTAAAPLAGTTNADEIPAGEGWTLQGLSMIQRTNFTVGDQGVSETYVYGPTDPYALDGKLLRLTGGSYGAAGSTYQTEVADFSQMTAQGSTPSGPAYWTAQLKNGLTYEYGNSESSQVLSPDGVSGMVRAWLLDKVSDAYGNNYTVTYTSGASGSSGIGVPAQISYTPATQGSTSSYSYTITFGYSSGSSADTISAFDSSGYALENNNLLSSITVAYQGTTIRYYKLSYSSSGVTERSLLSSVQECSDSSLSSCFPATTFSYGTGTPGVSSTGQTAVSGATQIVGAYDFTGDGLSDILYLQGSTLYTAFSNGSGFNAGVSTGINPAFWLIGDILRSGKNDILTAHSGVWWLYSWNGSAFSGTSLGIPVCSTCTYQLADVNGDGYPDIVQLQESNNAITISVALNESASGTPGFGAMSTWSASIPEPQYATGQVFNAWWVTPQAYFQSFNGVHLEGAQTSDLMLGWQTSLESGGTTYDVTVVDALVPSGSSFTAKQIYYYTSAPNPPAPQLFFGRFNSDSCTDFVSAGGSSSAVYYSACNGAGEEITSNAGTVVGTADWNGDGLTDLLLDNGGTLGIETATSTGFNPMVSTTIPLTSTETVLPLSVTGSGLADIGIINGGTLTYYLHNAASNPPDAMTAVTDGNNNTVRIGYASIQGNSAVYSAYSTNENIGAPVKPEAPYVDDLFVVQTLTLPDGLGGSYTKTYHYTDAREDLTRLDNLEGFEQVEVTDSRNGEFETTSYDLPFPYGGMVSADNLAQSGGKYISTTAYALTDDELDTNSADYLDRHFPYASSVTTTSYEVGGEANGEEVSQSVTEYQNPDSYGNFENINTTVTAGSASPYNTQSWTSDTTAHYVDDASSWCVNLPSSVAVEKTAYGEPAITHTATYTRDGSNCRPSQVVEDAGNSSYDVTRAFQYDAFGNIKQVTASGTGVSPARVWTYNWGTTGQFQTIVQDPVASANGYEEAIGYDSLGLKTSDVIQTTSGTQDTPPSTWSYDPLGVLQQESFPDGTSLNWTYTACSGASCNDYPDAFEVVVETAEQSGGTQISSQSAYLDSFGRAVAATNTLMDGTQALTEQQYDHFGNIVKRSSPCNGSGCPEYWTEVTYDGLNRPITILSPDPQSPSTQDTTAISYAGGVTTTTNAQDEVSSQTTDVTGAVRVTEDPTGYAQDFTLDSDGNVLKVEDSNSVQIDTNTYDYGGEGDYVATSTDRALGTWSYSPDALGEVLSYQDAKGQVFKVAYDGLGRPTQRSDAWTASGSETVTNWTWGVTPADHDVGKLDEAQTTTADGTYTALNTYDTYSRLSTRAITIPADATYTYTYSYNAQGLLGTLQYPAGGSYAGLKLNYAYLHGVLSSVTDANAGTVYWQANAVNQLGEVTQDTLGNGIITQRKFLQTSGLLTEVVSGPGPTPGSAITQNQGYSYYALGTVLQRQDNHAGLTENFTYDGDNRVLQSTLSNGTTQTTNLTVSYNPDGSIARKSEAGGTDVPVAYTAQWTSYNYPHSLSATTSLGTETATFDYGPDRQRWRMVYTEGSASETTEYIGGMMEKVSSTTLTDYRYYVQGGDGLAAIVDSTGSGSPAVHYVLEDHEGSIASFLNSTGSVAAAESFTAYGNRREASTWSGPPSSTEEATMDGISRRGFTGQTVLAQMGLNHMNGRVEDAVTGTFLSPDPYVSDPYNTQDYNRYTYVYDSPLSNVDPSGFDCSSPGSNPDDNGLYDDDDSTGSGSSGDGGAPQQEDARQRGPRLHDECGGMEDLLDSDTVPPLQPVDINGDCTGLCELGQMAAAAEAEESKIVAESEGLSFYPGPTQQQLDPLLQQSDPTRCTFAKQVLGTLQNQIASVLSNLSVNYGVDFLYGTGSQILYGTGSLSVNSRGQVVLSYGTSNSMHGFVYGAMGGGGYGFGRSAGPAISGPGTSSAAVGGVAILDDGVMASGSMDSGSTSLPAPGGMVRGDFAGGLGFGGAAGNVQTTTVATPPLIPQIPTSSCHL